MYIGQHRGKVGIEQKQAWMRDRHSPAPPPEEPPFAERHFSVAEIAARWNLSPDAVRRLFAREPGVLVLGNPASSHRRYMTLRIPQSVAQRVHQRLCNV
jgi:hypothetical protein